MLTRVELEDGSTLPIPTHVKQYDVARIVSVLPNGVVVALVDAEKSELLARIMRRPDWSPDRSIEHSLDNEVRLVKSISCPYLAKCIDVLYLANVIVFLMEACTGYSLISEIERDHEMVQKNWKRIFRQLCIAVDYLHRLGLAHRDIKLENVFLDKVEMNVKLYDYTMGTESSRERVSTACCGTVQYMSPEILLRKAYCPKNADVWALGVTLFAMVSGEFPWVSIRMTEMCREILNGEIETDELSEDARAVVLKCCEMNARKRASVNDVLEMMNRQESRKPKPRPGRMVMPRAMRESVKVVAATCEPREVREKEEVVATGPRRRSMMLSDLADMRKAHIPLSTSKPCDLVLK